MCVSPEGMESLTQPFAVPLLVRRIVASVLWDVVLHMALQSSAHVTMQMYTEFISGFDLLVGG